MEKFCVIVDGYSTGKFYSDYFKNAGYKCLHIQSKSDVPDFVKGCFCTSAYADATVNTKIEETISWISKFGTPEFIVPGCEIGVNLADELSDHFNTNFRNEIMLSKARRNKYLMTEQIRKANLRGIKQQLCKNPEEAIEWIAKEKLEFPIVVKPTESTSGDGFNLCKNNADVTNAFEQNLNKKNLLNIQNTALLVQEFIAGEEYVIDTVSSNGTHIVTDVIKYKKRIGNGGYSVYEYCDFLPIDALEVKEITEYVLKVLDVLEIKNGPAHAEVMVDTKGPVLIEIGARLAGCMLDPQFINKAYGHNQVELSALAYTSPKKFSEIISQLNKRINMHTSLVFVSNKKNGTVKSINFSKLEGVKAFQKVDTSLKVGQQISEPKNLSEVPAIVYLQSDDKNNIDKIKEELVANAELYIEVE